MAVGDYATGKVVHVSLGGTAANVTDSNVSYEVGTSDVTHSESNGWQLMEPTIKSISGSMTVVWAGSTAPNIDVNTVVTMLVEVGSTDLFTGSALITSMAAGAAVRGDFRISYNFVSSGEWTVTT